MRSVEDLVRREQIGLGDDAHVPAVLLHQPQRLVALATQQSHRHVERILFHRRFVADHAGEVPLQPAARLAVVGMAERGVDVGVHIDQRERHRGKRPGAVGEEPVDDDLAVVPVVQRPDEREERVTDHHVVGRLGDLVHERLDGGGQGRDRADASDRQLPGHGCEHRAGEDFVLLDQVDRQSPCVHPVVQPDGEGRGTHGGRDPGNGHDSGHLAILSGWRGCDHQALRGGAGGSAPVMRGLSAACYT